MKLKLKLFLPILLLFSLCSFAQKEKWEKIKALKVSYITTELELTPQESEKFWPIYNVYESKQYQIRHNKMKPCIKRIDEVGLDKMSAKEAEAYLNKLEAADRELFELREKLVTDLKPVIGAAKILKLKKAEEDFKQKLLEKYKQNKS
ncbi:sensor of ECF-type sigma factor [Flavobacterium rhizosphaerae]|uniref:Sensor of ECF-type sigma factor n=1 Tax=Flavobacterium rhizosphaerae TaxID=3163298 RepID=A0ABW8YUT2_9FLAO